MRTRIADLIGDAIAIIETCGNPDREAWLGQAKAELAVLEAKTKLREALTRQTLPDNSWSTQTKPKRKPATKPKHKPTNSKPPLSTTPVPPAAA